jgi:hypothetical protein
MGRKMLVLLLAMSLAGAWGSLSFAGEIGYYLRPEAFGTQFEPTSGVMFVDALVGRPMGLGTTILGTGVFVVTLPFTAPSGDVGTAARALVGAPAGWTFLRPLGQSDPRFEDKGVFPPATISR